MRKRVVSFSLAALALLLLAGPALAASGSGIWLGYQKYVLDLGDGSIAETTVETLFVGGYTAGSFTNLDFGGDYRFSYGMSDRIWRDSSGVTVPTDGHFYALGADGGVRLRMEEGLYLRIHGGVDLWWGEDHGNHYYAFAQGRAGAGLIKSFVFGRMTLEAETDLFFVLDYFEDEFDFGQTFLLQGLRTDGSLSLLYNVDGNLTIRAGVRAALMVDRGLFYSTPQSSAATAWEGWFGVGMSF